MTPKQPPIDDLKAIQKAYPDMSIADVWHMVKNPLFVEKAKKLARQNDYTQMCMEEICGFHISRILEPDFQDLVIDFNQVNPFYTTTLYQTQPDEKYTLPQIMFKHEYYEDIVRLIDRMSEHHIPPEDILKTFCLNKICKDIQERSFKPIDKQLHPTQKKEKYKTRQKRDNCFAHILQHIDPQIFFTQLFINKLPEPIDLKKAYHLQSKKDNPLTVMDLCLTYGLHQTATEIVRQTYLKTKNPLEVTALFSGEKTRIELYKAATNNDKSRILPAQPLVDYLHKILPTDLFIESVLQQKSPYYWKKDHEMPEEQSVESVSTVSQNKSTESKNNPKQSPEKQQTFFHILDGGRQ